MVANGPPAVGCAGARFCLTTTKASNEKGASRSVAADGPRRLIPTAHDSRRLFLGKIPTKSARRFTSLFSRSSVLVEWSFCRWAAGWASFGRLLCAEPTMARHSSCASSWVGWTSSLLWCGRGSAAKRAEHCDRLLHALVSRIKLATRALAKCRR